MKDMQRLERMEEKDFNEIWEIMEQSFPVDERRTCLGQRELFKNPYYRLYGYRREGKVAAFFAVWRLEKLAFVEHFAVDGKFRNGGLGAGLLQELLQGLEVQTVLEVEPPEREIAARRIRFYERNGFALNPYDDYVQPALSAEGDELPLLLMTYPSAVTRAQYEQIRDELYRKVYGLLV